VKIECKQNPLKNDDFGLPDCQLMNEQLLVLSRGPLLKSDTFLQSKFDKRDNLKREKACKREVFCAFWLVPQAECATFSGIILFAGALRAFFLSPPYRNPIGLQCQLEMDLQISL
jgi:hypothetical protein